MYTIVLLTEGALPEHDALRIASLHGEEEIQVHVLVPADTTHHRVLEGIDEVLLGRLREAARDSGDADPEDARLIALHALAESNVALQAAGVSTTQGEVAPDDPVALTASVARSLPADEIIVVTPPHLVEEALRRDWASRLRREVALPVLHTTAGTDRVIS